jgi:hypothetical protein
MDLTAKQARRLLLCKQGLGFPPAGRGGPAQLDRMITQLGFVQLDSITAVERAHHLTLRSRLPSYTAPQDPPRIKTVPLRALDTRRKRHSNCVASPLEAPV